MSQWLRTLVALAEVLSLVHSTHVRHTAYNNYDFWILQVNSHMTLPIYT